MHSLLLQSYSDFVLRSSEREPNNLYTLKGSFHRIGLLLPYQLCKKFGVCKDVPVAKSILSSILDLTYIVSIRLPVATNKIGSMNFNWIPICLLYFSSIAVGSS